MASDKNMLIEIQADDKGSAKVIRENTGAIKQMEKASESASHQVVRYQKSNNQMRTSSRRTNMVLMDTSRVLQDLPYGFRGVANNIDPLLNSLRAAKEDTGSWKTTLANLATGIFSPTGLLTVGVSTAVSVLLTYGDDIAKFFGFFEDGKKKVDDSIKSIKEIKKELSFFKSRKGVAFDLLEKAFPDAKGLKKSRLELQVIRQLQSQALSQLTQLQGAGNVQGQLQKINKQIDRLESAGKNAESILKNQGAIPYGSSYEETLTKLKDRRQNIQERINVLEKDEQKYQNQIYKRQVDINQAMSFKNSELGKSLKMQADLEKSREKAEKHEEKRLKSLKKANAELKKAGTQLLESDRKKLQKVEQPVQSIQIDTSLPGEKQLPFSKMAGATEKQRQALSRYNNTLAHSYDLTQKVAEQMLFQYRASEQLSKGVERLAEQGLVQLGESLGQVLSGNIEGDPFTEFKLIFADFMSFYGKSLIALGIGSKAFQHFIENPIVAIAAGTALVAAASAIRSSAQDKVHAITGGSGSQRVTGYRGLDFSSSGSQAGGSTQGPAIAAMGSGREVHSLKITNGFDKIVGEGRLIIDRNGGSSYLRGDA